MNKYGTALRLLCGLLVVSVLSSGAVVSASLEAQAPTALSNAHEITASLTGNRAGAFNYYSVDCPGGSDVVTIDLWFTPADPVTKNAFGFKVWSPTGTLIGIGSEQNEVGGTGRLELAYSAEDVSTLLVQVCNYLDGMTVSYGIVADGSAEAAPASAAGLVSTALTGTKPTASPAKAISALLDRSGVLTGNAAGAFAHWEVVVEDSEDMLVTLDFGPDYPSSKAINVIAYGPEGRIHRGQQNSNPGQRTLTLPSNDPGDYYLQLYNYVDGLAIQYHVVCEPAS
jgi:hypothetical protein